METTGRTKHRTGDNIRIYLNEIWGGGGGRIIDWIHLAQDRDQWRAPSEHGNETSGSMQFWEILE
jgi:hypothetical protein